MKKLIIAAFVAILSTTALAGSYPGVPTTSGPVEVNQIQGTINSVIKNVNTYSTGLIYALPATSATGTGTSEQILGTYSLPAGYLANTGQTLRIKATFAYAANTNNRTPKLYFGTSSITGTLNATSGATAALDCLVTRTGAATQTVACTGVNATTPLAYAFTAGTDSLASAVTIKATCTDGTSSAGDCTLETFTVESLR